MNKKILVLASSALAVATTLVAGGTYAYFTDQASVQNVITFGNVGISLEEPRYTQAGGNGAAVGVLPGNVLVKDPTITNTGNNPCFIRVKVDVVESYNTAMRGVLPTVDIEEITNLEDNTGWVKGDGYYYYQSPLAPAATVKLFEELTIPATWGNTYTDLRLGVNVLAEAIQSENFTPAKNSAGKIIGWGNSVS